MNIDEIKTERMKAEREISSILAGLEKKCRIEIFGIAIESLPVSVNNMIAQSRHTVTIRIEI